MPNDLPSHEEPDDLKPSEISPDFSEAETIQTPLIHKAESAEGDIKTPSSTDEIIIGPLLGEGGMARVYEATDVALNRKVALKVMKESLAKDAEHRANFFKEARILAQLEHPHTLPVYAFGERKDLGPYFTMKKVKGETLRVTLKRSFRRGRPERHEFARLMEIFEQVCLAVACAHTNGVVHRDLKPENIMVDDVDGALVLDWGTAKVVDEGKIDTDLAVTQAGVIKGTPVYMSPEQAGGRPVDFPTDVFSLGIILYEILTGKLPFGGRNVTETFEEVIKRTPESPRSMSRGANRVLSAICMKTLAKDPNDRYPSAKELCDDVRNWRSHLPTSAYNPRLCERIEAWAKRNPIVSTSLVTAVVVIVIMGAIGYHVRHTRLARMAEKEWQAQLTAEREAQEWQEEMKSTMQQLKALANRKNWYDTQIQSLKAVYNSLSEEKAGERQALGANLKELQTAREAILDAAQITAGALLCARQLHPGGVEQNLNPEFIALGQSLVRNEIENCIQNRNYHRAHFLLWNHLSGGGLISQTEKNRDWMRKTKQEVEALLLEEGGPNYKLPDWTSHKPEIALPSLPTTEE